MQRRPSGELTTGTDIEVPPLTFSFSAGGWFQMYHFGAGQALRDAGVIRESTRYVGTSAGSLAVAAMAGDCDLAEMRQFSVECAKHCRRRWWRMFFLKDYLLKSIHRFGDEPLKTDALAGTTDQQDRMREKVEVYATVLPFFESRVFNDFANIDDVVEAVTASCCMAPVVGFPFRLRKTGEWVCDGGLTAFQPRDGEPGVITISPFYFTAADIKPTSFLPFWWAIRPPKSSEYNAVFDSAYNDTIQYLIRAKLAPPHCIELLRDVEEPQRRFAVLIDLTLFCIYALFRPLAIFVVYIELWVLVCAYGLTALLRSNHRTAMLVDAYESARTAISFRTFMHLALPIIGLFVPFNELRLSKKSRLYRVFKPWIFEPSRSSRNPGSPTQRKGPGSMNGSPRKKFRVSVYAQSMWRSLVKKHPNLGFVSREEADRSVPVGRAK